VLTLWCAALVLLAPLALGLPARWLLGGRRPLGERAWLEAPFVGLALIILVLQNLVYLDVPLRRSAPFLWLLAAPAWLWAYRSGQLRAWWRTCPRALFAAGLLAYFVQGLGLFAVGARHYVGYGWADQFNYTATTQFLMDLPFSTPSTAIGNRPYLIRPVSLKDDRIGECVLQGFFAAHAGGEAKTLFEPTILLGPALLVLVVFVLARHFRLPRRAALVAGAAAGLLPGVAQVHLDCYLSQSLAIPLLLLCPVFLADFARRRDGPTAARAALLLATTATVYTELLPVIGGLVVLCLAGIAVGRPRPWRALGATLLLGAAPFALNPFLLPRAAPMVLRVAPPMLEGLIPWALQVEGLGRVWLGDWAPLFALTRPATLLVTVLAGYGLFRACRERLRTGLRQRHRTRGGAVLALAASVLALGALPFVVLARDGRHPYQYYKLLLSMSPLLVLGLAVLVRRWRLPAATPTWGRYAVRALPLVVLMGWGLAGAAATAAMALAAARPDATPRSAGAALLLRPDVRSLADFLGRLRDRDLVYFEGDNAGGTGCYLNTWLAYFARHNRLWALHPEFQEGIDVARTPGLTQICDLAALPAGALFLHHKGTAWLRPPPDPHGYRNVWENDSYVLWAPTGADWAVVTAVANPNGTEAVCGRSFCWLGGGDTTLDVWAARPAMLHLAARFHLGPSLAGRDACPVRIATDGGFAQERVLGGGEAELVVPVRRGRTRLTLCPLAAAAVPAPAGDPRPLLLGMDGLACRLEPEGGRDGRDKLGRISP
jgi:hypothetical protein